MTFCENSVYRVASSWRIQKNLLYHYWLFGHYHDNKAIDEKHILLWEQIVRII